ncbi:polysaccharide deacetylase family protein [Megalodesulfovibrio paquesii]
MSALASLKRRLKHLGGQAAGLGVPRLARRAQSLLVLCYHRVLPAAQLAGCPSSPHIVISEDTFARQMALLAAECAVLPLEDGLERLARRTLPRRAVAITFDDGWKDTLTTALPILEQHRLPALVYLSTGHIGSTPGSMPDAPRVFWQERLTMAMAQLATRSEAPALPPDLMTLWDTLPTPTAPTLIAACKQAAPRLGADVGERMAVALLDFLGHPTLPDSAAMLTWDDVRAMQARAAQHGIAFGSHTVDHVLLPAAAPEVRAAQLADSRQTLREALGQDVRALAYPNGDHTLAVRKAALEAGYTSAATLERGFNDESLDLMRVRRVNLYEKKTAGPKGYEQALFQWVLMTGR